MKFDLEKLETCSVILCEVYFDTLNCVGVAHECNRQTDGQTVVRNAFSNSRVLK